MVRVVFSAFIAVVFWALCGRVLYAQTTVISGIVNSYAKVTGINYCGRTLGVTSSSGFVAGDKALIIQMKGAIHDSSSADSSVFGRIRNYGTAGNFEFVNVEAVTSNSLQLREILLHNYDPAGAVQIIKVPRYVTAVVKGILTCPPWNGSTGGVLVVEASGAIDIQSGVIDVSGLGFRGGRANSVKTTTFGVTDLNTTYESGRSGEKGESVVEYSAPRQAGRAAIGNGGGGGNSHNSGGGGGANGGAGGNGSREYAGTPQALPIGGLGGFDVNITSVNPRVLLGGGGGGGHQNSGSGTAGGTGGGIVILKTNVFVGRSNPIIANGTPAAPSSDDGAGGGGAGGSVIVEADVFASYPVVSARGADGGNSTASEGYGTGGGGGGGMVCFSASAIEDSIRADLAGGRAGISTVFSTPRNASPGIAGALRRGCIIPANPIAGMSTVTINDTTVCSGSLVRLNVSVVGGRPPYSYRWEPSALAVNPNTKSTTAIPTSETEFRVIVTDSLGCQAQGHFIVRLFPKPSVSAGADGAVCAGESITLRGQGAGIFRWSPSTGLSDPTSSTPIANPAQTTTYTLTLTDENGCTATDEVTVTVNEHPTISLPSSVGICLGKTATITADVTGGKAPYTFIWSPNVGTGATINVSPAATTRYDVTVRDANGCDATANVTVTVSEPPLANAGADASICLGDTARLHGSGGSKRQWSPPDGLSDPTADEPFAFPKQTTAYILTTQSGDGCINSDTVVVTILPVPPKPTISVSEDTLTSSPAQSYQWMLGGVALPGANTPILIATQSGQFSVLVRGDNGCMVESDPVNIVIGEATLCVGEFSAAPGGTISVPLLLCDPTSVIESGAREIETEIRFNASLLLPLDANYLVNKVESGTRILRLRTQITASRLPELTLLNFRAGLGDDTVTSLRLDNYRSFGGKVRLSASAGAFHLTGVCIEGGARLWRPGGVTALLSISPQPAEDFIRAEYELAAPTTVEWTLTDNLGRRTVIIRQPAEESGIHTAELNLGNVPKGMYLLHMNAGFESASLPLLLR